MWGLEMMIKRRRVLIHLIEEDITRIVATYTHVELQAPCFALQGGTGLGAHPLEEQLL